MDKQLLGTGGVYYVMSQLLWQGFHASCTFGNAPHVDILVSTMAGDKSISLQVKTAAHAKRHRGKRGTPKVLDHYEWYLGFKAAKTSSPNLFDVFVDLNTYDPHPEPECYILPSAVVVDHCKDWVDSAKMARLHIPASKLLPFRNNWAILKTALTTPSIS